MKPLHWLQLLRVLASLWLISGPVRSALYGEDAPTPATSDVNEGQNISYIVDIGGGTPPFTFQWNKNSAPIPGATDAFLIFAAVQLSDAGEYTVTVMNEIGSTTSPVETLVVIPTKPSRLANISIVTSGAGGRIIGFSFSAGAPESATRVLARAAGPALTQFAITGVLTDPALTVFQETRLVGSNDDWTGDDVRAAAVAVGAFPFPTGSKDAALVLSLPPASYTAQVTSGPDAAGTAVVELYDLSAGSTLGSPRLIAVSARSVVGENGRPLVAGFTIQGEVPLQVLVRGLGPALMTRFAIQGALEDPKLTLFREAVVLGSNQKWNEVAAASIVKAASAVGAFALGDESLDSALLVTLQPGAYTAQLSSVSGGTGVGLIEFYEVAQGAR